MIDILAPEMTATGSAPRLTRLSDLLGEWETDAMAAHQARLGNRPRGPVTGLSGLDQELGGALPCGLNILHAPPGAGKTALLTQVATSCQSPAMLVTCEMSPLELFRRYTARVTGTYLGRLRSGELAPDASMALARRAAEAAPHLTIADGTQAFATPEWLRQAAEVARGESEHVLIGVDSVHSWAERAPGNLPEYDRLNEAIVALRSLALALSCPVLAVAERNRASMNGGGLSAGAGSRKLEYGGESVWDLHRDSDAAPDASGEVEVTLKLVKNRNGAAGRKIDLRFHGALQRFREA